MTEHKSFIIPFIFNNSVRVARERLLTNLFGLRFWTAIPLLIFMFASSVTHAGIESDVTIESVKAAISELEKLTQEELQKTGIPGAAIAIVYKDQVVYAKGFGDREAGKNAPVDANTVFQIASVSKPIASTIVAALVSDGAVTWDSRISDLDPSFEMYDPWVTREVTIRDLFAHRSGLPDHAGDLLEDLGFSREEILHRLRYQRPDSSFRSHYAYTNFGLTEGGVAAAKAVGKTWEEVAVEKLYKVLGMKSTSSQYSDFVACKNRAFGHVLTDGKWVAKYKRDPDTESPAGGVSSSVNDLAKWMRLQLGDGKFNGNQIIAADAVAETHDRHMLTGFSPLTGLPGFYGLGWNVGYDEQGRLRLSHSGAFALGAATTVYLVPSEELGIVILTNSSPIGVPEGLANTFLDLLLHGKQTQDWLSIFKGLFAQMLKAELGEAADYSKPPAQPAPALADEAYAGTYTNDFFGDIAIIEKDGGLLIQQGPNKMTFPMKHWDRDTFIYQTEGESAIGLSGVTFTIGSNDKATSVLVENLNISGEGAFTRKAGTN